MFWQLTLQVQCLACPSNLGHCKPSRWKYAFQLQLLLKLNVMWIQLQDHVELIQLYYDMGAFYMYFSLICMVTIRLLYYLKTLWTGCSLHYPLITLPWLFSSLVLQILTFCFPLNSPPTHSQPPPAVGLIQTESFLSYLNNIHITFLLSVVWTMYSLWSVPCILCGLVLFSFVCWDFGGLLLDLLTLICTASDLLSGCWASLLMMDASRMPWKGSL